MTARGTATAPRAALPARAAVAALPAALAVMAVMTGGCTIPITSQTITGGALNAGAMFVVDRFNDESDAGEGRYDYRLAASADTLAALFADAVAEANRRYLFPPSSRAPLVAGEEETPAADGVILASRQGSPGRDADPPASETFPDRQWTPAPLFSLRADSPTVRGDTLIWVVTHRAAQQVAFLLVPHGEGSDGRSVTTVSLVPYDPPADVFLSVPADHAQRNAVEALHQVFYLAVVERLGEAAFEGPAARWREPRPVSSPPSADSGRQR